MLFFKKYISIQVLKIGPINMLSTSSTAVCTEPIVRDVDLSAESYRILLEPAAVLAVTPDAFISVPYIRLAVNFSNLDMLVSHSQYL